MRGHPERGDKNVCIRQQIEALNKSRRCFGDAQLGVDESSRQKPELTGTAARLEGETKIKARQERYLLAPARFEG